MLSLTTVSVLALLFAQGCVSTDAAGVRLKAFSRATQQVTDGTKQAFDLVEARHFEAQVHRAVVDYDRKGFNPDGLQPFLKPASREARTQVLDALAQYAAKLADLYSGSQQAAVDNSSAALAARLSDLNKSLKADASFTGVSPLPEKDVQLLGTAMNAVASWLVRSKRDAGVRESVNAMDPHIAVICNALISDMKALHSQVALDYQTCMEAQDRFISKGNLDPVTKRTEIRTLAQLLVDSRKVEATFEAIESSILRLRDTHHALAGVVSEDAATLELMIQQLSAEARRVKAFHDSLANGS